MKHTFFEVWNFKGIKHIRLDFTAHPTSNIYTFVGLNESGKTTILQALNLFTYKLETLNALNLEGYSITDPHELIPIGEIANFNENITIRVGYKLDDKDKHGIKEFLGKKFGFEASLINDEFDIEQTYEFRNSQIVPNKNFQQATLKWNDIRPFGKTKRGKKENWLPDTMWDLFHDYLKARLPSILFFPNFLFEFPDKIYLESAPNNDSIHSFYRTIIQDILDATASGTNIKTHILDRAKDGSRYEKNALKGVLAKMESNITKVVFDNWDKIFKKAITRKEISVEIESEEDESSNKYWYLRLGLKENDKHYSISNRSLGFRWFFSFRLLTYYRGFRQGLSENVLFLLDEPASNLHSSAQSQLLESFSQFPEKSSIIYTTHSHHMINPMWLEGTFVVKNEGSAGEDFEDYDATNTEISLHKYREFAVKHPDQSNYFQPILDVLDYCPSRLENVPNVVMLEGKNDFYTLKYINEKIFKNSSKINLMPGTGAGSLDDVIRLYIAWGRNFVVLLDSDGGGKIQKERYEKDFGIMVENKIFSLEDINTSWKKKTMESLFTEAEKQRIQKISYPGAQYNKKHFNRAIQEAYLTNKEINLAKSTKSNFEKVMKFCKEKLKN